MRTFLALIAMCLNVQALPEKLVLNDGRVFEKVTSAEMENGKLKIAHSSGISRVPADSLARESQLEIGISPKEVKDASVPEIDRIETMDHRVYEEVTSLKIRPSYISFIHKDGSASIRMEMLTDEIRQKLHYNPSLAAEYDKKCADARLAIVKTQKKLRDASERKEWAKKRHAALTELEMLDIGSNNYWMQGSRMRAFRDANILRWLSESGYSPQESANLLDWAKYR